MRLAWAFVRRDWNYETTYRGMISLQMLSIIGSIVVFYGLGLLVGNDAPSLQEYGGEYFPFALVGLIVAEYFTVGLRSFSNRLRLAQTTGTLEAMFVTPTPGHWTIVCSGIWDFLMTTLRIVFGVLIGVLILGVTFDVNFIAAGLLAILSLLSFIAIGVIAAAIILIVKRGDAIAALAGVMVTIFAGTQFPVSIMPEWLRIIAYMLPLHYALDGLRQTLLTGASLSDVALNLAVMTVSVCILLPLAYYSVERAASRVRADGTLGHH